MLHLKKAHFFLSRLPNDRHISQHTLFVLQSVASQTFFTFHSLHHLSICYRRQTYSGYVNRQKTAYEIRHKTKRKAPSPPKDASIKLGSQEEWKQHEEQKCSPARSGLRKGSSCEAIIRGIDSAHAESKTEGLKSNMSRNRRPFISGDFTHGKSCAEGQEISRKKTKRKAPSPPDETILNVTSHKEQQEDATCSATNDALGNRSSREAIIREVDSVDASNKKKSSCVIVVAALVKEKEEEKCGEAGGGDGEEEEKGASNDLKELLLFADARHGEQVRERNDSELCLSAQRETFHSNGSPNSESVKSEAHEMMSSPNRDDDDRDVFEARVAAVYIDSLASENDLSSSISLCSTSLSRLDDVDEQFSHHNRCDHRNRVNPMMETCARSVLSCEATATHSVKKIIEINEHQSTSHNDESSSRPLISDEKKEDILTARNRSCCHPVNNRITSHVSQAGERMGEDEWTADAESFDASEKHSMIQKSHECKDHISTATRDEKRTQQNVVDAQLGIACKTVSTGQTDSCPFDSVTSSPPTQSDVTPTTLSGDSVAGRGFQSQIASNKIRGTSPDSVNVCILESHTGEEVIVVSKQHSQRNSFSSPAGQLKRCDTQERSTFVNEMETSPSVAVNPRPASRILPNFSISSYVESRNSIKSDPGKSSDSGQLIVGPAHDSCASSLTQAAPQLCINSEEKVTESFDVSCLETKSERPAVRTLDTKSRRSECPEFLPLVRYTSLKREVTERNCGKSAGSFNQNRKKVDQILKSQTTDRKKHVSLLRIGSLPLNLSSVCVNQCPASGYLSSSSGVSSTPSPTEFRPAVTDNNKFREDGTEMSICGNQPVIESSSCMQLNELQRVAAKEITAGKLTDHKITDLVKNGSKCNAPDVCSSPLLSISLLENVDDVSPGYGEDQLFDSDTFLSMDHFVPFSRLRESKAKESESYCLTSSGNSSSCSLSPVHIVDRNHQMKHEPATNEQHASPKSVRNEKWSHSPGLRREAMRDLSVKAIALKERIRQQNPNHAPPPPPPPPPPDFNPMPVLFVAPQDPDANNDEGVTSKFSGSQIRQQLMTEIRSYRRQKQQTGRLMQSLTAFL